MQQIEIEGLRFWGHHGVYESEQREGQIFEFDVRCELDRPSHSDELHTTIDYVELIGEVEAINKHRNYQLLETLAEAVITRLLDKYAIISAIEICVRKHLRLTGVDVDRVAVVVKRTRTER